MFEGFHNKTVEKNVSKEITVSNKTAVPNHFGTRDRFRGRQFFPDGWMVQVVMGSDGGRQMESDGGRQMKLHSLAHRSPPAVWPGS